MLLSRFVVVVCVLAILPSTVMAQAPPTGCLRSLDAASQCQNSLADLERAIGAPLP